MSGLVPLAVTPLVLVLLVCCFTLLVAGVGARGNTRQIAVLFVGVLLAYLATMRTGWSGDTLPARYLPISLIRERNFTLDEFPFLYTRGSTLAKYLPEDHVAVRLGAIDQDLPWYLTRSPAGILSNYPVAGSLLAVPFYLPAAIAGVDARSQVFEELEKLSAAVIAAASSLLVYLTLSRLVRGSFSPLFTIAYALGTSTYSISSQALWQHGPSQLALAATLYCLVRGREDRRWIGLAGLPLSFAVVCRPTNVLLAAPLALYVVRHHPREIFRLTVSALPPVLFQVGYNYAYFGEPLRSQFPLVGFWSTPILAGLAGLLMSPGRGLFVYSPFLIFAAVGLVLVWRARGDPLLRFLGLGSLATVLLTSKWFMWWGGYTYGPRLLADLTPGLVLGLSPLVPWLEQSPLARRLLVAAIVWSIGSHAIGAFGIQSHWNAVIDVDRAPEKLWLLTDNPIANVPKAMLRRIMVLVGRFS